MSGSRERKKEKKEKKEKKAKKEKKEKKDKKKVDRSRSRHKEKKERKDSRENSPRYNENRMDVMKDIEEELEAEQQNPKGPPAPESYVEVINGLHYKVYKDHKRTIKYAENTSANPYMIEVIVNDRMGNKTRVKCCPTDSVRDLKKLVAAHTGTRPDKIRLQRWHSILKDHITLQDYEINHGGSIDMYYN